MAALLAVSAVVIALGRRDAPTPDDPRRSTFVAGPRGASAYAEALQRLGVRVERFRRRPASLPVGGPRDTTLVLAILGPAQAIDPIEAEAIVAFAERTGDVLLAGRGARTVIRCFGWRIRGSGDTAWLMRSRRRELIDSSSLADGRVARCSVPEPVGVDTLRHGAGGGRGPAVVRLRLPEGRAVTIAADDRLFSNRALRHSSDAPFALRLVAERYGRVLVDEYHHGYGAGGTLGGAVLRWSGTSPWGWAAWQLAGTGLVALLAGAVRFGPARPTPGRRRRSPLEHVRALAAALGAARGHDVATRLIVRGLRRRLAPGEPARGDPVAWLAGAAPALRTERARASAAALLALARRPADAEDVRRAGELAEDIWEELRR